MSDGYDRRWYVYAFWTLFIPLVVGAAGVRVVSDAAATGLMLVLSLSMAVAGVWGLLGYYWDARDGRDGYQPRWYLWALAHIILSPLITSPIYLIRRTSKTGLPPRVASVLGR